VVTIQIAERQTERQRRFATEREVWKTELKTDFLIKADVLEISGFHRTATKCLV